MKRFAILFVLTALSVGLACSSRSDLSYKDNVEKALQ